MKSQLKRVTSLGLGLVMTGGMLSACGAPAPRADPATGPAPTQTEAAPAGGAGEGGEGEGGVAVADASTNAVVYNAALAIAAAHVIAARDAYAEGELEAAAEMFAHPVSEVLLDMEPVFAARGAPTFGHLFTDASIAVFDGERAEQIAARAEAILAALDAASAYAPDDGSSPAAIAAGVAVDQIDRASDMYRIAQASGRYGPYLDGYGFFKAAELAFSQQAETIEAEDPVAAARIRAALSLLATAYPSAAMPDALGVDRAELASVSAQAMLAVLR